MEMDKDTAQTLNELTRAFYKANADSFSETRQHAWRGWHALATLLAQGRTSNLKVLDLACGNFRLERYLADVLEGVDLEIWAYDNSEKLLATPFHEEHTTLHVTSVDLVAALLEGPGSIHDCLSAPPCDVTACYGFMHHVPGYQHRAALLDALVEHTRQCGFIAVSFWQFMNDKRLASKALATTELALEEFGPMHLEENDYLMGWKDTRGSYRYCHHFDMLEIERLSQHIASRARLLKSFDADGKGQKLNHYCIWQRL